MPKAVVQGRIAVPHADKLRGHLGGDWTIETWDPKTDDIDAFAPMVHEATAIIGGGIPLKQWPAVPQLKLFQIPWTGYEFCNPQTMPEGVPVCNCFEHESAIAEFIMAGILEWQLGLRIMDERFRKHGWDGHGPGAAHFHGEVLGRTVGIIGYGHIGHEVAKRAKAFGMNICGIRRSAMPTPLELDWLGQSAEIDKLLASSDFVVVACDLNAETKGMIDAKMLSLMKADAVIINIARGAIIVESDLFDALKSKQIGGAILDVWYNYAKPNTAEPWPCNFPFQDLDNVILSAHESGWTREQVERRWAFVAQNLQRVAAGELVRNIVFNGEQQTGM